MRAPVRRDLQEALQRPMDSLSLSELRLLVLETEQVLQDDERASWILVDFRRKALSYIDEIELVQMDCKPSLTKAMQSLGRTVQRQLGTGKS